MLFETRNKFIALTLAASFAIPFSAMAGVTYKDGEKFLKVGGRVQVQFHQKDPDDGKSTDKIFMRRLRPYIAGSVHENWSGKLQWEIGGAKDTNEVSIKEAYMEYKGFDNIKLKIGNAIFPFSREALTSSKKQQIIERSFVGDHNYGSPDKNVGVHLTGATLDDDMLTWGASIGSTAVDPDAKKLDLDTPLNRNSDFNEGWMVGGRVDYHPFGKLKKTQGDFKGDMKATIGVGAYSWSNDDDINTNTTAGVNTDIKKPDVDSITAFEISSAIRMHGVSVDLQYNTFSADSVDSTVTSGLYQAGTADITQLAIEGGYMVVADKVEIVAAYETQDADTYADAWNRTSVGANVFFEGHDIKLQTTYRIGENLDGVTDSNKNELFVQMQYVF